MGSNELLRTIYVEEGLPTRVLPPGFTKPSRLLETAFGFYGFLPEDEDERWQLVNTLAKVQKETPFSTLNFENAMLAVYLSDRPSRRTGYTTSVSDENIRQTSRALHNLSHRNKIAERFARTGYDISNFDIAQFTLAVTDRVISDPTGPRFPITPCPEALYQVRLFYHGAYLARAGINFHHENDQTVMSIANLQGIPNGLKRNAAFTTDFGLSPFNAVIQRLKLLAEDTHDPYLVRGLKNPKKKTSAQLYNTVFAHEDIPTFSMVREAH